MGKHGKHRALVAAALTLALAAPAGAECRQALALALDVSGSVDMAEYRLQKDGLAQALRDPRVVDAFLAMPGVPVRLMVYEWSGMGSQRVLLDWTDLHDADAVARAAAAVEAAPMRRSDPATALGRAMQIGAEALASQGDCGSRTLDVSGDGKSNVGPHPHALGRLGDITVNALVIGNGWRGREQMTSNIGELVAYFRAEVLRGPDAFVEAAADFEDFSAVMIRKLLRELQTVAVGALDAPRADPILR